MRKKIRYGEYDLLIAANATSTGATLVTDTIRELKRVPELLMENGVHMHHSGPMKLTFTLESSP